MRKLQLRLRSLFRRRAAERELDEEIRDHLEREIEANIARGMTPQEARRAALRAFGGVEQRKEESRDTWGRSSIENRLRDVRYALRVLRKNWGVTVVVVLTLGLGIGANAAIFGVIDAVLIRPLPYSDPGLLFSVETVIPGLSVSSLPGRIQDYLAWRKTAPALSAVAALSPAAWNLTGDGDPERISAALVSPNFFDTLGVQMRRGRAFTAEEEQTGKDRVVVISDELWRRRYAADAGILGRNIRLDGVDHVIIGVTPPSLLVPTGRLLHVALTFGPRIDVWRPLTWTNNDLQGENWNIGIIARINPGERLERVQQQLQAITLETNKALFPDLTSTVQYHPVFVSIREIYSRNIGLRLLVIFGASGLLLLIACTNIANLLLARAVNRSREFAIRTSLGAGRHRVMMQMFTETVLLALIGGVVGILIAYWGNRLLVASGPIDLPLLTQSSTNVTVLVFAMLLTVVTGFGCGLLPAWHLSRKDVDSVLKEGPRLSSGGINTNRFRTALITIEVGLVTLLLASAGLLLHSFINVMNADRGYETERILTAETVLVGQPYRRPSQRIAFYQSLIERIQSLPGVSAAGAISDLPANRDSGMSNRINYPTDTLQMAQQGLLRPRPIAGIFYAMPGYFAAVRSVLLTGRFFDATDQTPVAVISENLARQLWPSDALPTIVGRQVRRGDTEGPLITIVGIIEKVQAGALDRELLPQMYMPHHQGSFGRMSLVMRTALEPSTVVAPLRAAIHEVDPNLPLSNMATMKEILTSAVAQRRFQLGLTLLFGSVALLLAAIGIYGVVSHVVVSRTRDIGLRIALGARPANVLGWAVFTGMRPVLIGLLGGLGGAMLIGRTLRSMLYGIAPIDPLSLGGVVAALVITATIACYVPARRAAQVSPMVALRHE